jgi:hypothetical protein
MLPLSPRRATVAVLPAHDELPSRRPILIGPQRPGQDRRVLAGPRLWPYRLACGAHTGALNFSLARQGQVTDRYTKAIEQLGSDKLEVRIGGIYALERIAHDSPRDHPTIMEVLWPDRDESTRAAVSAVFDARGAQGGNRGQRDDRTAGQTGGMGHTS